MHLAEELGAVGGQLLAGARRERVQEGIVDAEARLHQIRPRARHILIDACLDKSNEGGEEHLRDLLQILEVWRKASLGEGVQPRGDEAIDTNAVSGLHVDHTRTGDSRRGRDSQVLHLKHNIHVLRHEDNLGRNEAQLLILVEDSVHRLNPKGIDGAVKDNPLAVAAVLAGGDAEELSNETVAPLTRRLVEPTVQLRHRDGLGVEVVSVDGGEALLAVLEPQLPHGLLEDARDGGLTAHRRADGHLTVAEDAHLVHFDALL